MSSAGGPTTASAADIAMWTQQLADADAAYHQLATGNQLGMIRHGDREMQYSKADLGRLFAYRNQLRFLLGLDPLLMPRTSARRILFGA